MKASSVFGLGIVALLAIFGLTWAAQGNNFFLYKVFAPKYEEVRHDVFKESQSYVDGKITHLTKLQLDYVSARTDEAHKCTIRIMALREFATIDEKRLPADLVTWASDLKGEASCAN